MVKRTHILMLFDVPERMDQDQKRLKNLLIHDNDYIDERDVFRALKRLGYDVTLHALHHDIDGLIGRFKEESFDLVFCMFESFRNARELAPHVVSLFEVMGVKYTGADAQSLAICRDKSMTKKIVAFHELAVPKFCISRQAQPLRTVTKVPMPAIVKPLGLEASEGVYNCSVVKTTAEALTRVQMLHKQLACDVIIEEFIEGREFYVGVMGKDEVETFPPQELKFLKLPKHMPRIASFKAKWDKQYRRRYGIDSGKPRKMSADFSQRLQSYCKKVYEALEIKGYARIDLRVNAAGEIYFLEANPNPAIKRDDDFPASARQGGLDYDSLIERIVELGFAA